MSKNLNSQIAVTICILVLLVINMVMMAKLLMNIQQSPLYSEHHDALPCRALPARFVIEEPECADKLLRLMNITNIHILTAENFDPPVNNTLSHPQNQSAEKA